PSLSVHEPAPTQIYTLSLHDALPISSGFGGVLLPKLEDCLVVIDEGHQLPHTAISASAASCHLTSTIRRVVRWQGFLNSAYRALDRKSTRLNSSHVKISYAVFCLKKK